MEPEAVDTEELPELPAGWAWASLPELGELNRGKSKHRPRDDKRLYGDAYPFIQTGDVRHANGVIRSYTQSYSEFGLAQSRLWPTGTLCITIAANIAETALLGFDACFPDSVVGFLTPKNHSNIKFIEFFLRTAKENIERYAPATAQKNINLEILSKVGVPVPSLEEQKQIVDEAESRLTVLDALSKTLADELKRAERLRQSILHRAFTGRLVPQDATDEPAAALLARLQNESTAPPKARKAREPKTSPASKQLSMPL
ncbi:restriction endonuclease subunit S [Hymenobacter sp. BT523]|uniref:restriction endonuclease subunit S n=1 Tax=Hymenobacter sp. BT523 TaxID=2795725 RepID=UPI0018EAFAA1|nr:restriction endonuclease subunit S [Hymenobacter sp. BT523]MBJ6111283.1 restriction endonuclease subunit S [Hymenobacter sp. BT523]